MACDRVMQWSISHQALLMGELRKFEHRPCKALIYYNRVCLPPSECLKILRVYVALRFKESTKFR